MVLAVRDIRAIRERIVYFKKQAEVFRSLGKRSNDAQLRDRFCELSRRCDAIAANIERNLSIHEKAD